MFKDVIQKIYQKPFRKLTMILAKPGDGRTNLSIELSNALATNNRKVCYCNIRSVKKHLMKKLLQNVEIISGLGTTDDYDCNYFLKRLKESTYTRNAIILIDDFSDIVTVRQCNLRSNGSKNINKYKIQIKLLEHFREIAIQKNSNLIVTDTIDPKTPLNETLLDLCDDVYLLYKDDINEACADLNWYKLKLKRINY